MKEPFIIFGVGAIGGKIFSGTKRIVQRLGMGSGSHVSNLLTREAKKGKKWGLAPTYRLVNVRPRTSGERGKFTQHAAGNPPDPYKVIKSEGKVAMSCSNW